MAFFIASEYCEFISSIDISDVFLSSAPDSEAFLRSSASTMDASSPYAFCFQPIEFASVPEYISALFCRNSDSTPAKSPDFNRSSMLPLVKPNCSIAANVVVLIES